MEEDINDVIEEENDNKLNVADDDEIKHEGVQNHDLPPPFLNAGLPFK